MENNHIYIVWKSTDEGEALIAGIASNPMTALMMSLAARQEEGVNDAWVLTYELDTMGGLVSMVGEL